MKRQQFSVVLEDSTGVPIETDVAYAHNSGVRKSEALVRAFARDMGCIFHGGAPTRNEHGYRRTWSNRDGVTVTALVWNSE